jgi:hypothetical protein
MKPRWRLAPAEHVVGSHVDVQELQKFTECQHDRTHRIYNEFTSTGGVQVFYNVLLNN